MARLWQSGFGLQSTTGSVEFSSISAGVTIQNTVTRVGPYAMRTNPAAAIQFVRYHGFASDQSIVGYQRFYLRIATAPGANTTICRFVNTLNDPCAQLRLTASSTLILLDAAGNTIGSASAALTVDTWYLVELGVDASTSPGTVTARLDGSEFASGANSAQAPWARWLVGPIVSATCDLYFADWAVNDTSGTAQTSWPGAGVVVTLFPNAAGDSNDWNNTSNAAGSANNYLLVDEAPPDDATTMVQTGTLNAEDSYNATASGMGASDTVNCVMVGARFRNNTADAVAAARLQIRKAAAGTTTQSADLIPNATSFRTNANAEPRTYPIILHTDPDGSAWTQTTVDSMQIGVKLTTAGTQRIQVTSVWAVVDYTPSTGTNASAGAATSTGAAGQPSASIKPSADVAAGTGAAHNATPTISPTTEPALGTGTAHVPSTAISTSAGAASGTGTAYDATAVIAVVGAAQAATGTGTAHDATVKISPNAQAATGTGTAHNAITLTGTLASASTATGTGVANNPSTAISPPAGAATSTGTAHVATVTVSPTAQAATGAGAALDPTTSVKPSAGEATGTGAAANPATSVAPTGGAATGSGTANNATATVATGAGIASATGAAFDATVRISASVQIATGSGTAYDATATTTSGGTAQAGLASGTGTAYDATVTAVSRPLVPGTWYGLLSILREAREEAEAERVRLPMACPEDGEPLRDGPAGQLFCGWDGWRPDGSYVAAGAEYAPSPPGVSESLFADTDDPWF